MAKYSGLLRLAQLSRFARIARLLRGENEMPFGIQLQRSPRSAMATFIWSPDWTSIPINERAQ
jgi:hypothetical protein